MDFNYFLPGRIVLWVEHPERLDASALAERIAGSQTLRDIGIDPIGGIEEIKVTTFPPADSGNRTAVSMVKVAVHDDDIATLIGKVAANTGRETVPISPTGADDLIQLRAAAPSLIMTATPHGLVHGGPGSRPEPAPQPAADEWAFTFENDELKVAESEAGQNVVVAILDTCPCVHDLASAYHRWAEPENVSDPPRHALVDGLLNPQKRRLTPHPASFDDLSPLVAFSPAGHGYPMADHGLFVAGIINSIAPQASLHLYEVLGEYGVGSIETIAQGMLEALKLCRQLRADGFSGKFLVNCSFMLNLPEDGQPADSFPAGLMDPSLQVYMRTPLQQIVNLLLAEDITIVAAAGNEAGGGPRPPARYPAAFEEVIGVGALPREPANGNVAAAYSNMSDQPPTSGFVTLGGGPAPNQGILGVYLGPIPGAVPPNGFHPQLLENGTGWAIWSGTSFATPIVTGMLARTRGTGAGQVLLNQDNSVMAADRDELVRKASVAGRVTPAANERVLVVRQGP
jgi:hypothetical protein